MKSTLLALFLAAGSVWAQQPQQPAPKPLSLPDVPPDTVVAVVNGEKMTAGQLKAILEAMDPKLQQNFQREPRAFMQQYAMLDYIARNAVKAKLDEQEPTKSRLKSARMQILWQAAVEHTGNSAHVSLEEQQKHYEANKDKYTLAHIKAIYLPFSATASSGSGKDKPMTEAEARVKAEKLVKEARSGVDFVKLVKENSKDAASAAKDGDFGAIRKGDSLPPEVKNAIFSLKKGEVSDPVRMQNGFYIFRVEQIGTEPFEKVKNDVYQEVRGQIVREWFETQQKTARIDFENTAFFPPETPRPAPPSLAHPAHK
ncbi:MAG: peptidylprolyl isomerase [Bryobacterales bacterium]|nr:peptidylprolyl isomerase [Bryobacterales bacterium]